MELIGVVVGGIVTLILSLVATYAAKKAGIGNTQEMLIANLNRLVDTQGKELQIQATEIQSLKTRVTDQDQKIDDLTKLTVAQAAQLTEQNEIIKALKYSRPRRQTRAGGTT